MFRVCHYLTAVFLWLAVAACSEQSPSARSADYVAGPILVRVSAPATLRFLHKLRSVPGVWGVQRHAPGYVLFMAPRPRPNTLTVLLSSYPHWDRPVRLVSEDPRERRVFAAFDALFKPLALAPPGLAGVMPAQADALPQPDAEVTRAPGGFQPESYAPLNFDRHTSEYFAGSIAVGIVLPESNGSLESSTENWMPAEVTEVVAQITQGLMTAQAACKSCGVSFVVDLLGDASGTVETDYEVINHPFNDMNVNNNVLSRLGVTGVTETDGFRQLANQLRAQHGTDWAVIVKVARNTSGGNVPYGGSSYFAVTYLGGPFMALTLGNDTWGTSMLGSTFAHELNHAFYALDEYAAAGVFPTSLAGYFKVGSAGSGFNDGTGFLGGAGENDGGCVMNHTNPSPPYEYCAHTQGQIGWIDDNADGIPDVTQQPPRVSFTCGTGTATVNTNNTYADFPPNFPQHAVGLGTIARVEYRVNQLTWLPAAAQDGAFDEPVEPFTVAASLPNGTYALEARAVDSYGNTTRNPPRSLCAISASPVAAAAPFAALASSHRAAAQGHPVQFDAAESSDLASFRRGLVFRWDWNGDAVFDTSWSATPQAAHAFAAAGTYSVVVEVKNAAGLAATRAVDIEVLPVSDLPPIARLTADRQYAAGSVAPVFNLSVQKSADPEGAALSVRWDLDGDGTWDTPFSAALVTTATYSIGASASDVWESAAEVRDPAGNGAIAYLNLRAVAYNHAPVAALAQPGSLGGFAVALDASGSSDADAAATWDQFAEYRWDFEGDGAFDTTYSTAPQINYDYGRFGVFSPTVEVRDRFRVVARQSRPVTFVGTAPVNLSVNYGDPLHPVLSWSAVGGAVAYWVQVAGDATFASLVFEDRSSTPELALPVMPAGTYVWRVSALTSYYDVVGFSAAAPLVLAGPGATGVKILPAAPDTTEPLQAQFTLTGGASAVGTHFYWTRDGKRVAAFDDKETVTAEKTNKHEMWVLVVTPGDGSRTGAPITSKPVDVGNSPPAVASATVQAVAGGFECAPQKARDDDGDELEFRYAWTRDGTTLDEASARLATTTAGEYVCAVTPFDGEDYGETVVSAPQSIASKPNSSEGGCQSSAQSSGPLGLVWGWLALLWAYRSGVTRRGGGLAVDTPQ